MYRIEEIIESKNLFALNELRKQLEAKFKDNTATEEDCNIVLMAEYEMSARFYQLYKEGKLPEQGFSPDMYVFAAKGYQLRAHDELDSGEFDKITVLLKLEEDILRDGLLLYPDNPEIFDQLINCFCGWAEFYKKILDYVSVEKYYIIAVESIIQKDFKSVQDYQKLSKIFLDLENISFGHKKDFYHYCFLCLTEKEDDHWDSLLDFTLKIKNMIENSSNFKESWYIKKYFHLFMSMVLNEHALENFPGKKIHSDLGFVMVYNSFRDLLAKYTQELQSDRVQSLLTLTGNVPNTLIDLVTRQDEILALIDKLNSEVALIKDLVQNQLHSAAYQSKPGNTNLDSSYEPEQNAGLKSEPTFKFM